MAKRSPKTFGYVRASTRKQVESPEVQKQTILAYAKLYGLGKVEFCVDESTSGAMSWEFREGGKKLLSSIQKGDNVVITKIDRAWRRLSDCVLALDHFMRVGVNVHVCNMYGGAFDLSSPAGRFMLHIMGCFAELERQNIAERTKEAMAYLKLKKRRVSYSAGLGNKFKRQIQDGKWVTAVVEDPEERRIMRSIVDWKDNHGMSWNQIYDHMLFTLNIMLPGNKPWNVMRIRRAYHAEKRDQEIQNATQTA